MTPRELFDQNIKLAYKILKDFNNKKWRALKKWNLNRTDFQSAALYALWKACLGFKPEKGFQFSSYTWDIIWRDLNTEMQHLICQDISRHRVIKKVRLLSGWNKLEDSAKVARGPDFLEVQEEEKHVRKVIDKLRLEDRLLVQWYYYDELDIRTIAKIRGISPQRISQVLERVRKDIERILNVSNKTLSSRDKYTERSFNFPRRRIRLPDERVEDHSTSQENAIRVWEDMSE